jgi:hypothetical protein
LSVLAHELGHLLGQEDDLAADPFSDELMADTLPLGVRRSPNWNAAPERDINAMWALFGVDGKWSPKKRPF